MMSTSASPAALAAATVRNSGGTPRRRDTGVSEADSDRRDGEPDGLSQPEVSLRSCHPLERAPVQ
jgi:hypothetical protein